jgi:hypothetical protein
MEAQPRFHVVFEKLAEASKDEGVSATIIYSASVSQEAREISELRRLVDDTASPPVVLYTTT